MLPLTAKRDKQDVRVTKATDSFRTNPYTPWEVTHIIPCAIQPAKEVLANLVPSVDIDAGKIDLVNYFLSICLFLHYTQRPSECHR